MNWIFNRSTSNLRIIILAILLIGGISYYLYATFRHFQAINQVNEAKATMGDIQRLLAWSIMQPQKNAIQVCNLQNIQQITKQQGVQEINQLLNLHVNIYQHSKYVESIKVYPAPDLQGCMIRAHFRNSSHVNKDLAGKYIIYLYDFKKRTIICTTNIKKRALVKYCTRL